MTDYRTAAFYKLLSNALIAANVILADEAWQVAQKLGVDWPTCHSIAQRCPVTPKAIRVDPERRGFKTGACLPKDLNAFVEFAREARVEVPMFEQVQVSNDAAVATRRNPE